MFGILNLAKPAGPTSRDCVNSIERILRPVKVGHAGTLDPIASGVLLVLVGQAVRLTDAIHTLPKKYVGTFRLGVSSESADTESEVFSVPDAPVISLEQVQACLPSFVGQIEQTPPKFSAVWVDGKRAHELARKGRDFDVPKRIVSVQSLEATAFDYPIMSLSMVCGTGTYVRSIGRDIAQRLGTDAVMTELQRTAIGPFTLETAVPVSVLKDDSAIRGALRPAREGVLHWPQWVLPDVAIQALEQGKRIRESEWGKPTPVEGGNECDLAAVVDSTGMLRALVKQVGPTEWRADKCFILR